MSTRLGLTYGYEIRSIGQAGKHSKMDFETDLSILERNTDGTQTPRVVVEAKLGSITTHDAITYSHKASSHKAVFPYLRYGIVLANRGSCPLPGRLYRHGQHFDFMFSFRALNPSRSELNRFIRLLRDEVIASRTMERLIYESRKRDRQKFTVLHRKLVVE